MRMLHVLSLLVAISLVSLLAGCGGGGGGNTPPTPSAGTLTVTFDDTTQEALYTPPADRSVYAVYAYFDNIANTQIVSANFDYDYDITKWRLDLSVGTTQFSGTAIGTFDMTVYVIFSDDTSTPIQVSPVTRLTDLSVMGSGPPPPPWGT